MTTKHTPGPWRVNPNAGEVRGADWDVIVADVFPVAVDVDVGHANARLIAAAPDLLAACEMLAEAQRRADAGEHDGFGCYVDAVDKARAAIAKAKGEKP